MADDYEYEDFNNSMRDTSDAGGSTRYGYDYEDEEFASPGPRSTSHRRSNQEEEEEEQHQHLHHNRGEDEDDEQQQQKLNGKIEILQQRVDQLQIEVMAERQQKEEVTQKYAAELELAHKQIELKAKVSAESDQSRVSSAAAGASSAEIAQLQAELKKWKAKCESLQDKLDVALITNPSASNSVNGSSSNNNNNHSSHGGNNSLPPQIQEELLTYCEKYSVFPELQNKASITTSDALKIFQSIHNHLRKKAKESSKAKAESKSMEDDEQAKQEQLNAYHNHHKLNDKIKVLEEELKLAANHADDIAHLKNRVMQLSDRVRVEKEYKKSFETECTSLKRKVDMLSDHIEKLVMHIRREGAAKVKFAEQSRVLEKDNAKWREKYDGLYRKMAAKDRLIYELREGSRVLEDQLKLMDEKYLELRNKLDYARYVSEKKIKKSEKVAAELRVKYAMLGSVVPLDSLPMPSSASHMSGSYDGMSVGSFSAEGNYDSYPQPSANSAPPSSMGRNPSMRRGLSKLQVSTEPSVTGGPDGMPTMTTHNTMLSSKSAMSIDDVLEKIRVQHQGSKNDWTEEKVRKLVAKSHK